MHQEHNIPWNRFASHVAFIPENPRVTPHKTDIFYRRLPKGGQDLNHFTRTFSPTIAEFSSTERKKYANSFDAPISGKLFSDELLDCHPEFLTPRIQLIENWILATGAAPGGRPSFDPGNGDLADAVKTLLYENEMGVLLANHPLIPLRDLHYLSWGHSFGFSHLEDNIPPYLFLNIIAAMGLYADGRYKDMDSYPRIIKRCTNTWGFPAQNLLSWEFFGKDPHIVQAILDIPEDFSRTREYLKRLFTTIYRYDMLVRECEVDMDWPGTLVQIIDQTWNVGHERVNISGDDANPVWRVQFVENRLT